MSTSSRHTWEPGNSTRYEIHVTPFEGRLFGCSDGGWVVVGPFPDRVRALVVPKDSALHYSYVAEKMDLNEIDASCVAVMVGKVTGITAWPSDEAKSRMKRPFTAS